MRGMHKAVYRAYAMSPHDVQATLEAVRSFSYCLQADPRMVVGKLAAWLQTCALGWPSVQQLVSARRYCSVGPD